MSTKVYDFTLAAFASKELLVQGNYWRIQSSTANVQVTRDGGSAVGPIGAGQGEQGVDFVRLTITDVSGGPNVGTIIVSDGTFVDNRTIGSMSLTGQQGAFTSTAKGITNVSGILANANGNRRYLLIQNNDATGNIYVNLAGVAATTANSVKIAPGGTYELQGYVPNGAIYAIGDIATNLNVVLVEG